MNLKKSTIRLNHLKKSLLFRFFQIFTIFSLVVGPVPNIKFNQVAYDSKDMTSMQNIFSLSYPNAVAAEGNGVITVSDSEDNDYCPSALGYYSFEPPIHWNVYPDEIIHINIAPTEGTSLECTGSTNVYIKGTNSHACQTNADCTDTNETGCDPILNLCTFIDTIPVTIDSATGEIDFCYTTHPFMCSTTRVAYCKNSTLAYGHLRVVDSEGNPDNCEAPECFTDEDCQDGNVCNGLETCQDNICVAGTPEDCDDNDSCTMDSCDPATGCSYTDVSCSDGLICTVDSCDTETGSCVNKEVEGCCTNDTDCDDGVLCTTDNCNPDNNKCIHTPIPGCCTEDLDCDDGFACTQDSCDVETGSCSNNAVPGCCTADSECDDQIKCTDDSCNLDSNTCQNTVNPNCCTSDEQCDDNNLCTNEFCDLDTNTCQTSDVICDDELFCNGTETCNPESGCEEGIPPTCLNGTCDEENDVCDNQPLAIDDAFSTAEDTPVNGNVLNDNGFGADNLGDEPTSVSSYDAVSANGGIVTVNPDGSFNYTPPANFNGIDSFSYTITDSNGDISTATVTITVTCQTGDDDPEICDGIDNDCDGQIDEDLDQETTCGEGQCASTGVIACVDGHLQEDTCTPSEPAANDAGCDGIDNDCDGTVDEDFVPTETTCGTGACSANGSTSCVDGQVVDNCEEGTPSVEICDGLDNDCDGIVDNVPGVGDSCDNGKQGQCHESGVLTCDGASGETPICNAPDGIPGVETCSNPGEDNDCDGIVDNVAVEGDSCDNGEKGQCHENGILTCDGASGETPICNAPAGSAGVETCSNPGEDNDCDGIVDNVPGEGNSCDNGEKGQCHESGVLTCDGASGETPICNASKGSPEQEICDGLDNDCDDLIDEDLGLITCGVGECASTIDACVDGKLQTCVPGEPGIEICDGLDNDCDGEIDNGGDQQCDDGIFCDGIETCGGENGCQAGVEACTVNEPYCDELQGECLSCLPIQIGDYCSQTNGGWGQTCSGNNVGCNRDTNFITVFPNGLIIGGTQKITLTSAQAIENFLPSGGPASQLTSNHVDPRSTEAGVLAGQIVAATLNVEFSKAGFLNGNVGPLLIQTGPFSGLTVDDLMLIANAFLGGDSSVINSYNANISDLNQALTNINQNFIDCAINSGFLQTSCEEKDNTNQTQIQNENPPDENNDTNTDPTEPETKPACDNPTAEICDGEDNDCDGIVDNVVGKKGGCKNNSKRNR